MLTLTRRVNESIVIRTPEGREIRLVVLDRNKGKVRIGVVADDDVTIWRDEIDPQRNNTGTNQGGS